ncbi:MAG TPA: type I phosphomannose isomerase catalytic subunit [Bacillota bacterium]
MIYPKYRLYPLKFYPLFMERIWGGTGLREEFGKEIPSAKIGESWEVSCRPDAMSIVAEGPLKGRTLGELITEYGPELLGTEIPVDQDFPLLLKILDAQDVLSVQVHPGDEFAAQYEHSLGKSEVWYVLKAKPGAKIIYGLKPGITRQRFTEALDSGKLEECLNEVEVQPGDVYPVDAGVVHALGAGIIVAEFQQNSDLTYRVYDWQRLDDCGKPRPLHLDRALQVIDFSVPPIQGGSGVARIRRKRQLLHEGRHFTLEALRISGEEAILPTGQHFVLGLVSKGKGGILYEGERYALNYGDSFMIPAGIGEYSFYGDCTLLLCAPKGVA